MGESISEIAERQHGVVSASQLRALGLGRDAIGRRVVLASGVGAAASHRSGGHLWDLRQNSHYIEVTAPRQRQGPRGVIVHRSRMMDQVDFTEVDGIPVTSVSRTLLDLAGALPLRDLGYVLDRAERLRVFDLEGVEDVLHRARGKPGAKALRKAIAGGRPADTKSVLEDLHLELVATAGIERPRLNVVVRGERHEHVVDAFWPLAGVVVQLDGFDYHRTRRDRERDAAADADLELAGYRVLRLTWDDVAVQRVRTTRRLRAALTARGAATRG